jgi:two-component sensor histidine kinase
LREVHHRVKNNLQVVMSLLGTQSAYLRDDAAISAVLDSQHRVQSMALLHQRLYKSNDATAIEMQDYIEDLVDYLRDTAPAGQTISFQLDIEPVTLDVVQAVPMGLLINEVVTNSIKHAFPGNRAGRISLSFRHAGAGLLALSISDDGVGLPEHITPLASNTFGLRLIRGLAEDLDAEIRINARSGLSWTFSFKYRSAKEFATAKSE